MSRVFIGVRNGRSGQCEVHVEQDGKRYRLTHRVRGARVDFCWDQAGPRSRELAKALLWNATGIRPRWGIYSQFAGQVVAKFALCDGECWRLSDEEIKGWLAHLDESLSRSETPEQTGRRRKMMRRWANRVRRFAEHFEPAWKRVQTLL